MIVFCENCGKRYKIDGSKIGPNGARFRCKVCSHFFTVAGPSPSEGEAESAPAAIASEETSSKAASPSGGESGGTQETADISGETKSRFFGLRAKMILLFFIIPVILIAGAGVMYLRQVDTLTELINKETLNLVEDFSEQIVAEKSRSVATQVKLFLDSHPELEKEDFNYNMNFKRIAVQKVGMTGYTAVYERPRGDGVWQIWAHPNPDIIGVDTKKTLQGALGDKFNQFWKVYSGVKGGKEASGYYMWKDSSGQFREKFMVCTPVPGSPFVVATTTYLDEFERHANRFKARSNKVAGEIKQTVYIILGATLLLVGLAVSLYGQRLTGKIKKLTDLAERISVGELDAAAEIKSNDEIGDLGEAISRMQTSIRYSIERLRRR